VTNSEHALTFRKVDNGDGYVELQSNEHDEFCGEKAKLTYAFYEGRLISAIYNVDFSKSGNPFAHDGEIRTALEQKYGTDCMEKHVRWIDRLNRTFESTTNVVGLDEETGAFDLSKDCHRYSTWVLPKHKIWLMALAYPPSGNFTGVKSVSVSFETPESERLSEQASERARKKSDARQDADSKKL
jgi:hypothetical protein